MALWLAIGINLACVAAVLLHSARRDMSGQAIGTGGWVLLCVLFGPITLVLYALVARRAPRR